MTDSFYLRKSILNTAPSLKWGCPYMSLTTSVRTGILSTSPLKVSSINVLRRNDKKVFGGLYTHKVTKFC